MVVTFCGHGDFVSTSVLEIYLLSLLQLQIGNAPVELYLGGYGRFDSFALRCGRNFQNEHPCVSLVYVTPYIPAEGTGGRAAQAGSEYDEIIYPPLENVPPRYAIIHRNRYMVDRADLVIAYITRSRGGAYQTYQYAQRRGKSICNLAEI